MQLWGSTKIPFPDMCVSSDSCSLVSSIAVVTVTEEWKGRFICGLSVDSLSNYQRFCNFYQLLSTASQLSPSPLLKINFPFHLFCEIFSCMFGNLLRTWKVCRLSKLCKIYQEQEERSQGWGSSSVGRVLA